MVLATGTADKTTTTDAARRFASRSRKGGCRLGYFEIEGAGHYLLGHAKVADYLIRSFVAHALGTGDELIGSSISAEEHRPPDRTVMKLNAWRYVSGPTENFLAVLAWKRRGHLGCQRQNLTVPANDPHGA